jgi:putative component of membrane protein insertase Oxa1/YidC/SpoIIIJ protein YidD
MKWFLIGAIYLYRCLPARFKRQCLFKETCSSLVTRVARESGLWLGLLALRTRVSQCRPGYLVYFDNEVDGWHVRFANGSVSKSSHIADFVLGPYTRTFPRPWSIDEATAPISDESDLTVVTSSA